PADATIVTGLFNINDQRRTASFYDSLFNASTGKWVIWPFYNFLKFIDQSSGFTSTLSNQGANAKVNFPIIRYADVLLLYAEALNEVNGSPTPEAYAALNLVRARSFANISNFIPKTNNYSSYNYAGSGTYSDHSFDVSALSQLQFRDTIFVERRKEFIQESQRWFDLVRRVPDAEYAAGQYYLTSVKAMLNNPKAAASLKDTLFPIPQTEIDLYGSRNPNFTQNAGW
ncbi:MAG TPA: RagB/SusD family nutrient uptake outer membrane protein, partial [Chitinophagaceae bacterium]|nr:RagB/SusD family nutrient uptake outer membrane protein [Chitinophagaceae bacterium]